MATRSLTALVADSCRASSSNRQRALYCQRCAICHYYTNLVDYVCESDGCGIPHRFSGYHAFQPINCGCGHLITQDDLRRFLDDGPRGDMPSRINCGECGVEETVIRHGDTFLCVECFYDDSEIGTCDWCGEQQIGSSLLDSSIDGCVCCHCPQDRD